MKNKPTDSELEILAFLWQNGPSSVRQVHEELSESKDVFYTTTLKTMQVMLDKGFLDRDTSSRSHIYRALISQSSVQQNLLQKLKQNVFGGSTEQLILSALGSDKPSEKDLELIQSLIDKMKND